jgi:hypothetical protein
VAEAVIGQHGSRMILIVGPAQVHAVALISKMASTSTATPVGNAANPSALRA